jgi:hypothetical protein
MDIERSAQLGKAVLFWVAAVMVLAVGTSATVLFLQTREVEIASGGKVGVILTGAAKTFDKINAPCQGSGKDKADNCGTLALAGQMMVSGGDLIKTSQINENSEAKILSTSLPALFHGFDTAATNLATASADLHPLLTTANDRIAALEPIETNAAKLTADVDAGVAPILTGANGTITRANSLLDNPFWNTTMQHAASSSITIDHMLFTADQVETKLTKCTLHPTFVCQFKADAIFGAQVGGYLLH